VLLPASKDPHQSLSRRAVASPGCRLAPSRCSFPNHLQSGNQNKSFNANPRLRLRRNGYSSARDCSSAWMRLRGSRNSSARRRSRRKATRQGTVRRQRQRDRNPGHGKRQRRRSSRTSAGRRASRMLDLLVRRGGARGAHEIATSQAC
jgi:hypothetical protein